MRVLLGFHFRNDQSGVRGSIFDRVRPIVEDLYEWSGVIVADSGHPVYNRAASRNVIVREALKGEYDVVAIFDADSIPEQQALITAIREANQRNRIICPFNQVKVLSANTFLVKPKKYQRIKPVFEYGESFGGVYVTAPETWRYVGGMDERIEGWGFEDQILLSAAKTFLGGPAFVHGTLHNINHVRDMDSLKNDSNNALIRRYHAAEGKPDEFRAIQSGSNRFCPN